MNEIELIEKPEPTGWRVQIVPTRVLGCSNYTLYTFVGDEEAAKVEGRRVRELARPCWIEGIWLRESDLVCVVPDVR